MPMIPPTIGKPASEWQPKIETATRMLAAGLRKSSPTLKASVVRRKIVQAAREALSDASGEKMYRNFDTPTQDALMSSAGVFRFVLVAENVPWSNAVIAETVMSIVQRTLDTELKS